tara:strand:- start:788 stop:955 length:168 start_codon:yes stop_codon:yes gene_type:complete
MHGVVLSGLLLIELPSDTSTQMRSRCAMSFNITVFTTTPNPHTGIGMPTAMHRWS